jgi:hypothetical protein
MKTHERTITVLTVKEGNGWVIHPCSTAPGQTEHYTDKYDVKVDSLDAVETCITEVLTQHFNAVNIIDVTVKRETLNEGVITCRDYEILAEVTAPEGATFQTIEEIKQAVDEGKKVFWSNRAYEVIKDSVPQYLIKCNINQSCIGLTNVKGNLLNGCIEHFFIDGL